MGVEGVRRSDGEDSGAIENVETAT